MKYKLRHDLTKDCYGTTLYRIERLSNGELGGWIEHEINLSQHGACWVSGDARVFEDAQVFGDARVFGAARVYGDAQVSGAARVYGDARVSGAAQVSKPEHLVSLCIPQGYNITVTPQNVVIGCQVKTRKEWEAVTLEQAKEMELREEMYSKYKEALKILYSFVEES